MVDDQTRPVREKPSPTKLVLILGLPIGLGIVSAQTAQKAATQAGAGGLASFLIPIVAAAIVAGSTAAVVVWLLRHRS